MSQQQRRYRPLGLMIAIAATAVGYGLLPMFPLLLVAWSNLTQRLVGIDFIGGTLGWLAVGLGALTLVASVGAWIGRPRGVRLFLLGMVWLQTFFGAARWIASLSGAPSLPEVSGTFSNAAPWLLCQVPLLTLVPLYVTWYLNRAPARQFYR
ncbi:MAG: hypothetical protein CUN49_04390 [Candidatus Thermofonsia Clade 1 bacterium]|uniref:DUF2569 domain-containing protein n=1 Tax=Candidatus Thermofonsia Clade 1 bacterium TaxID=2364210 RepID=A0A2M8PGG1_9CHLR|nr:MAG: hypothetical protein CUN49_04390 [Candidatus Thermofonsia Clade 1 bacterium]RMF54208.1 MAG: hypothetical protein D6749_00135 [Chloroflexota bacterium]